MVSNLEPKVNKVRFRQYKFQVYTRGIQYDIELLMELSVTVCLPFVMMVRMHVNLNL